MKKYFPLLAVFVILLLYLFLRLNFQGAIEFGYDQPILASRVIDFLKKPSFIESYNFVESNPWGYPSWGPAQIFFYAFFLIISKNPITVSLIIGVFNILSIIFVIAAGSKFFSPRVGIIAGLILATQPWWVVFSRMIYEPTPVPSLVAICMFLSFYIISRPRSLFTLILVFLWGIIFQVYIHTISFIVPSLLAFLFSFRKLKKAYFLSGLILCFTLFIPVGFYYLNNPDNVLGFLHVIGKFQTGQLEKGHSTLEVVPEFLKTISGSGFRWQLGYSYQDFLTRYPYIDVVGGFLVIVFGGVILYQFILLFREKEKRQFRLLLIAWLVGPIWFLTLIKTPIALPRYYLLSLPAFSLLLGLTVSDIYKKIGKIAFIFPIAVSLFWMFFIINYFQFIETYSYPYGVLSPYSDPPYRFLESAINFIQKDASEKRISSYSISNSNNATDYALKYVYNEGNLLNPKDPSEPEYMLIHTNEVPAAQSFKQFGPYAVYLKD